MDSPLDPPAVPQQLMLSPELFDVPFLEAAKRFVFTGARLLSDPVEVENIVADLCLGASLRTVCARYHRSHNTIAAVMTALEATGKLDTLEKRIAKKLGFAQELALDRSIELLVGPTAVPPNVLPIMVRVYADKKAVLDGRPTAIVEHRDRELNTSAINDLVAQLPAIDLQPVPLQPERLQPGSLQPEALQPDRLQPGREAAEDGRLESAAAAGAGNVTRDAKP